MPKELGVIEDVIGCVADNKVCFILWVYLPFYHILAIPNDLPMNDDIDGVVTGSTYHPKKDWLQLLSFLSSALIAWLSLYALDTGWWFGTFFIFPYIGNNHPNWLIFFRGVAQPPTRLDKITCFCLSACAIIFITGCFYGMILKFQKTGVTFKIIRFHQIFHCKPFILGHFSCMDPPTFLRKFYWIPSQLHEIPWIPMKIPHENNGRDDREKGWVVLRGLQLRELGPLWWLRGLRSLWLRGLAETGWELWRSMDFRINNSPWISVDLHGIMVSRDFSLYLDEICLDILMFRATVGIPYKVHMGLRLMGLMKLDAVNDANGLRQRAVTSNFQCLECVLGCCFTLKSMEVLLLFQSIWYL